MTATDEQGERPPVHERDPRRSRRNGSADRGIDHDTPMTTACKPWPYGWRDRGCGDCRGRWARPLADGTWEWGDCEHSCHAAATREGS